MATLVWDKTGERYMETGVDHGVLYPKNKKNGEYSPGVAWNGLTSISESPSGADNNDLYADNIKYATLRSAEDFGCTIEAYTYPDEFAKCDGSEEIAPGVMIGQQNRDIFGLSYRTKLTNDEQIEEWKLHLVYGCTASPSEKGYSTINDSPDAISFSWEITTTPVNVKGFKPTALLTINTMKVDKDKLANLEEVLYGTDSEEPRLPLPDEVVEILGKQADEVIEG